jgi:hypothetical protein
VSTSKRSLLIGLGVVAVAAAVFLPFWYWIVERVEVQPEEYLILVHRWGKDLPENEILAPDDSYKGIMLEEKAPGRYFLNPIFWSYERLPLVKVESGQCLVLTRKYGNRIPEDRLATNQILADKDELGIVPGVMLPGSYRLNKYAYRWETVPAFQVRADQVGVHSLKVGLDPHALPEFDKDLVSERYVVPKGYQGIQKDYDKPGTYYLNPYVETITPVEVQEHQVELSDISFPSRDGFILKPHIKVVYAVIPERAPELLIRLSSEGKLHQDDTTPEQIKNNEILQRIILPHIRGYARIEGSNFDARDFIGTESIGKEKAMNYREQFQRVLLDKVKPKCEEVGISVRIVTVAGMEVPQELTAQITARDLARAKQEKNKTLITQYKSDQSTKAAEALTPRAEELNQAEIRLNKNKVEAEQKLANEKVLLENDLAAAKVRLDAAKDEAKGIRFKGEAEAKLITQENEAKVAGIRQAILGFSSVQVFAQFNMLSKIAPALTEIFASDDSEFAKIIAAHMTQPPTSGSKTAGGSQP